ncbi:MAG TPA: hypothetical protein VMV49_00665 [Candidatus Deferrimicrobium sp.]|nr:hypothetical protein [Candidatus Deferrimicrobium sp.]
MGLFNAFWKMLGNIGKRVFNRRETKTSLYLFGAMHHTMIDTIAETCDGNYEEAMDKLIGLVAPTSEEIIYELMFGTAVMGVSFKKLANKFSNPDQYPFLLDFALYAIFGSWCKKIFEKTRYIPASKSEENVETYVVRLKSCPFCYPTMLPPEKFGKHRFGKMIALTIAQMSQQIQTYLGRDVTVLTREVKCFHQGDPYGEIRIWLYPRDQPKLMDQNEYLQKIK